MHERPDSMEAFTLALRLGATGLATNVWLTSDGVAVVGREGSVRRGLRRRAVADLTLAELPEHVVTVDRLYEALGSAHWLSFGIAAEGALDAVVAAATAHEARTGQSALARLWLHHPDWEYLAARRADLPDIRLVNSVRLSQLRGGPERRAAQLGAADIDAVSMPHVDWTAGLVVLFRRFEVYSLATEAEHERHLDEALACGVDGVSGTHADRVSDALSRAGW